MLTSAAQDLRRFCRINDPLRGKRAKVVHVHWDALPHSVEFSIRNGQILIPSEEITAGLNLNTDEKTVRFRRMVNGCLFTKYFRIAHLRIIPSRKNRQRAGHPFRIPSPADAEAQSERRGERGQHASNLDGAEEAQEFQYHDPGGQAPKVFRQFIHTRTDGGNYLQAAEPW